MNEAKKILVIAPHADDEILGCGGYLLHEINNGAVVYIMIATVGNDTASQDMLVRLDELRQVSVMLGINRYTVGFMNEDATLESVPIKNIVGWNDSAIDEMRPDEVLVNYSSHHQDHKHLYNAAMASLRLKDGFMPKFVALYEYPFVNGILTSIDGGRWYHDISDVISDKVELFKLYKSQNKPSPSPLNEDGIKALARIRGLESGCEYAELFYIQKLIR